MTRYEVGQIIRKTREERHMSKQALAEACGYEGKMAYRVVYGWECGERDIPCTRLRKLAEALQIPVERLIP